MCLNLTIITVITSHHFSTHNTTFETFQTSLINTFFTVLSYVSRHTDTVMKYSVDSHSLTTSSLITDKTASVHHELHNEPSAPDTDDDPPLYPATQ